MIVKDSNVLVVALAGNVVTGLAKGLRGGFTSYASVVRYWLKFLHGCSRTDLFNLLEGSVWCV